MTIGPQLNTIKMLRSLVEASRKRLAYELVIYRPTRSYDLATGISSGIWYTIASGEEWRRGLEHGGVNLKLQGLRDLLEPR